MEKPLKHQRMLGLKDLVSAFDKVPHRRLLHKLDNYGIRGSTNRWINLWLFGRTQQVLDSLGLIFWVTFCSNCNTLTFHSKVYLWNNLSGVKLIVIVSPLTLVDAHTKITLLFDWTKLKYNMWFLHIDNVGHHIQMFVAVFRFTILFSEFMDTAVTCLSWSSTPNDWWLS